MNIYYLENNHENYHEIEKKERVIQTVKYLKNKFLKKLFINENDISFTYDEIIEYLCSVYSKNYLSKIENCKSEKYSSFDMDTHVTKYTMGEIINSNGLILNAINNIINNKINYAYCLVRPPSHHSSKDYHSGFCLINNTFLAAKYYSDKTNKKVLIFDWDLHHGDGTEKLVRSNNNGLIHFVSIHCYDNKKFFPGTGSSKNNNEFIKNIPMNKYSNDDDYYENLNDVYKQISDNNYQLIIISNGLDAHEKDFFSAMNLTTEFYKKTTEKLKSFNIPLLFILEGGYNVEVIKEVSEEIISILI